MTTKIKLILLVLILSGFAKIQAQDHCTNQNVKQYITGDLYPYYYAQYNGTPLLNSDWLKGSFTLISGQEYHGLDINYDIFKDELLYYNSDIRRIIIVDKAIVKDFYLKDEKSLQNDSLHVVLINSNDTLSAYSGFIIELVKNKISLYEKRVKLIQFDNMNYNSSGKLGKFFEKSRWFYQYNNEFIDVPKNRRTLAKKFPEHTDELLKYMKKSHLKPADPRQTSLIFIEINRLYQ